MQDSLRNGDGREAKHDGDDAVPHFPSNGNDGGGYVNRMPDVKWAECYCMADIGEIHGQQTYLLLYFDLTWRKCADRRDVDLDCIR